MKLFKIKMKTFESSNSTQYICNKQYTATSDLHT